MAPGATIQAHTRCACAFRGHSPAAPGQSGSLRLVATGSCAPPHAEPVRTRRFSKPVFGEFAAFTLPRVFLNLADTFPIIRAASPASCKCGLVRPGTWYPAVRLTGVGPLVFTVRGIAACAGTTGSSPSLYVTRRRPEMSELARNDAAGFVAGSLMAFLAFAFICALTISF